MTDNTPSPNGQQKIIELLTQLIAETKVTQEGLGILNVSTGDVAARQTQHTADIRELNSGLATTRRALDPKALGQHVGDNIDQFMGEHVETFVDGIAINRDAAQANINAVKQNAQIAKTIQDKTEKFDQQSRSLANIATRLEERDTRSKWDWVSLGAAMIVAAGLAGGGAVYFTKQELDSANFSDAIRLIQNDDDAYWCRQQARAATFQSEAGDWYCAVRMPKYQVSEEPAEGDE